MSSEILKVDETRKIAILGGVATITIKETHAVLGAKSLYGAGTTKIGSSTNITFDRNFHNIGCYVPEALEIANSHRWAEQHVIDYAKAADSPDQEAAIDKMCFDFVEAAIVSYMFESEATINDLQKRVNRY
jgi:hypothetical protein